VFLEVWQGKDLWDDFSDVWQRKELEEKGLRNRDKTQRTVAGEDTGCSVEFKGDGNRKGTECQE